MTTITFIACLAIGLIARSIWSFLRDLGRDMDDHP